jgi:hypothetical protein
MMGAALIWTWQLAQAIRPADLPPQPPVAVERRECTEFLVKHERWLGDLGAQLGSAISTDSVTPRRSYGGVTIWNFTYPLSTLSALADRWQRLGPKDGERARADAFSDLGSCRWKNPNLMLAAFEQGSFSGVDLSEANLTGASFVDSTFANTQWRKARLIGADLRATKFYSKNDFTDAQLMGALLQNAQLGRGTSLRNARLDFADVTGAFFEPYDVSGLGILGTQGLSDLQFDDPTAVVSLRKAARDNALDMQVRALTAALFKNRLETSPFYARFFANVLEGGKLTNYGVQPWQPVLALFVLIPVFAIVYAGALIAESPSGICVIHFVDGPIEHERRKVMIRPAILGRDRRWIRRITRPIRRFRVTRPLTEKVSRFSEDITPTIKLLHLWRVAFYFSLLNAFEIGYKELKVGSWISSLQRRPYTLKPIGWVRTVAGLQALLSVYLLALWAVTFFGNPFEY